MLIYEMQAFSHVRDDSAAPANQRRACNAARPIRAPAAALLERSGIFVSNPARVLRDPLLSETTFQPTYLTNK